MPETPRIKPKPRPIPTPDPRPMNQGLSRQLATWLHTAVGRPLTGVFLAQNCALCHLPSANAPICPACAADLPTIPPAHCDRCGLPMGSGLTHCPDCHRHPPRFDTATAAWVYGFPVDTLIRDFKYGHHLYLGQFFAEQLAIALEASWRTAGSLRPDLIVPMPLHPNRLRSRGFNQAAEIARHLSRHLQIPSATDVLVRMHDTPPQAGLPRAARWQNLLGAFTCPSSSPIHARNILLVDDVLTTGASLSACADVLRQSGAGRIDVAVVARTPSPEASSATER
jgi:ComF family protein